MPEEIYTRSCPACSATIIYQDFGFYRSAIVMDTKCLTCRCTTGCSICGASMTYKSPLAALQARKNGVRCPDCRKAKKWEEPKPKEAPSRPFPSPQQVEAARAARDLLEREEGEGEVLSPERKKMLTELRQFTYRAAIGGRTRQFTHEELRALYDILGDSCEVCGGDDSGPVWAFALEAAAPATISNVVFACRRCRPATLDLWDRAMRGPLDGNPHPLPMDFYEAILRKLLARDSKGELRAYFASVFDPGCEP